MAPQTAEAANIIIPDDGVISPRAILGNIPLRLLSQRSDPRGALQLGAHFGCMSATGLLVWLCLPYWYLLVPAMALHGVAIVTMFAPMHECVHRTAFASRLANDLVGGSPAC